MIRAYKYKLHPNKTQRGLLMQFFGCARFIYNWGLDRKTKEYKENNVTLSYVMLAKELTLLKQDEQYSWLNTVPIQCLQQSLRNLDSAYNKFFKEKKGYPKFKSKKDRHQSIKMIRNVHFDFETWRVKLPKLGWVKLCKNKPFDKSFKQGTITVSIDPCGTIWCSVIVENGQANPPKTKVDKQTAVGIDVGIKHYATLSDGTKVANPKYYERSQRKLTRLQRKFAKQTKGSKRRERQRIKIAKLMRYITNQRNDMLHKLSTRMVRDFDTICLEDLNVEGMLKNGHLSKSIQSASWATFKTMLTYKCDWYGKNLLYIDRFEPSSKTCSKCGYKNTELTLSIREWICTECGTHHDRDVNAAINIRNKALEKVC